MVPPPKSLAQAIEHVRNGGRLLVPTFTRCTIIDGKRALASRGRRMALQEEGHGYCMRTGKSSVVSACGTTPLRVM